MPAPEDYREDFIRDTYNHAAVPDRGPLLHGRRGPAAAAAPAPTPGGCGRARPGAPWSTSARARRECPQPSVSDSGTASTDRRPQSRHSRGVGRRVRGGGRGQRSAPSPHFGGQPPLRAHAPALESGGWGGGAVTHSCRESDPDVPVARAAASLPFLAKNVRPRADPRPPPLILGKRGEGD